MTSSEQENSIVVDNLTFGYTNSYGHKPVLKDLDLKLPAGSRCLLIGANGAGKSTLLKVLGGRHLTKPDDAVVVLGKNPFRDTSLNFERSYLDMDWGMKTVAFAGYGMPLQADIRVGDMMKRLQEKYPERRDELIDLLGVDPEWRMHMVSDGQRRRVQILLGLIRPFKILLLDEVTTSLDVVVRQDLLRWLEKESKTRECTIVYATHIFDGLDDWPTHVHYLTYKGDTGWQGKLEDLDIYQNAVKAGETSPLLRVAVTWLRKEMELKKKDNTKEAASGTAALEQKNVLTTSYVAGGGFTPGRMMAHPQVNG